MVQSSGAGRQASRFFINRRQAQTFLPADPAGKKHVNHASRVINNIYVPEFIVLAKFYPHFPH
jgi:hypothetical protein